MRRLFEQKPEEGEEAGHFRCPGVGWGVGVEVFRQREEQLENSPASMLRCFKSRRRHLWLAWSE